MKLRLGWIIAVFAPPSVCCERGYVARFYDPVTAHFIQADTIVPEAGSSKAYDRYGYANNNPVRYNNPSGHCVDGVTTVLCIEMAAGAIAGYAVQVGENHDQGMDWGSALTTNISGEKILGGALIAGGVIIGAAAASIGLAAVSVTAGAACADGDCTNEVISAQKASQSVWDLKPFDRGRAIENTVGRSSALVHNFPVIDRWRNGVATSIKSNDLAGRLSLHQP